MKYFFIMAISTILLTGCVTLPDPVDETYLKDLSSKDAETLETIERSIIKITNEKDELESDLKKASQQKIIAEKELEQVEAQHALLQEKHKIYIENKDEQKAEETKKELDRSTQQLKTAKLKKEYYIARQNNARAMLDLKTVELAYKVGEHRYEQAKIVRAKQEKLYGKEDENSDVEMIDIKKYKEYYDAQKKDFISKQKKQSETGKAEKKAKKALLDAGYKGQLE